MLEAWVCRNRKRSLVGPHRKVGRRSSWSLKRGGWLGMLKAQQSWDILHGNLSGATELQMLSSMYKAADHSNCCNSIQTMSGKALSSLFSRPSSSATAAGQTSFITSSSSFINNR
eukprot:GEZU01007316.1.p1 GENE.GEZU01007316.1~~GEZU01007316.1.p1  ORF type:complete len:115 (+),score=5.63 GEZU01007316.1:201-545(+)